MNNTHDLEEDRDCLKYGHGISGSDAETSRYEAEDYHECGERCGLRMVKVHEG